MRISDWSSDVCSSDLDVRQLFQDERRSAGGREQAVLRTKPLDRQFGALHRGPKLRNIPAEPVGRSPSGLRLHLQLFDDRSEELRVGNECVIPCRSLWSTSPSKKHYNEPLATRC